MQKKKKSFVNSFARNFIFLFITSIIIIITLEIFFNYQFFKKQTNFLKENYIAQQKQILKINVENAINLIKNSENEIISEAKSIVKNRTYEAYNIAMNIYKKNKNKPVNLIKKMIKHAIESYKYDQGKGYFFMTDLNGKSFIFSDRPEMENKNLMNVKDTHGKYVVKDMIKIVKSKGEGFYEYTWSKPGEAGSNHKKISYVKFFAPLKMFIGTGFYFDDIEKKSKIRILKQLSLIRFGKEGYIYVNKLDGTALVTNGKLIGNRKLWDVFKKGDLHREKVKKIFQMEIKAYNKPNGDFIYYTWEELKNPNIISPKVAFIKGYKPWKWIIGAEANLNNINSSINKLYNISFHYFRVKLILFIIFSLFILFVTHQLSKIFQNRFTKEFNIFTLLIKNSIEKNQEIEFNKLKYKEFIDITKFTNFILTNLKNSETKFRRFFENSSFPYLLLDRNGYIDCNQAAIEILKAPDKQSLLVGPGALSPKYQPDGQLSTKKAMKIINDVFNTGKVKSSEWVLKKFTGESFWVVVTFSLVPFENREAVLVTWIDITQLKELQQRIEEEKENLEITLNSIDDAVIKVNIDGKIELMNPVAEKFTGWHFEEVKGKSLNNIFKIYNAFTREREINLAEKVLESGKIEKRNNTVVLISKFGSEYFITDSASPIRDKNNKIVGIILVFRDVTEKIKDEKELLKTEKLKSLGILAGGIAHDFNNMLTSLFGYISLAKQVLNEKNPAYKFIDKAENSLENVSKLTQQLLTFSKGGEPVLEDIDIETVIEETVKFHLRGSNVKPIFNFPEEPFHVKADKGQISQVISNITINALQAMKKGGNFFISIENTINPLNLKGKFLKITMKDEGNGIPENMIDKIFDPYFTTKPGGSGLGLATVYSIITKHNGKILVESKPGNGSTFIIYLPATEFEKENEKTNLLKNRKKNLNKKLKILLMDDDKNIQDLVKDISNFLGHKIEISSNGNEAIEKYKKSIERGKKFDIVILDLTIPGNMGGKETIAELLKIDPEVIAIVASGYSEDEVMKNFKKYGFKARLTKPYTIQSLKEKFDYLITYFIS